MNSYSKNPLYTVLHCKSLLLKYNECKGCMGVETHDIAQEKVKTFGNLGIFLVKQCLSKGKVKNQCLSAIHRGYRLIKEWPNAKPTALL